MLFSVFTPTFNRADLLHRVFDSLAAQSYRDFEWIVIDDGSVDDTQQVLAEFSKKGAFPIKVHCRENRGKVRSINEALDLAKGELFVCFDSDDFCTSDALRRIAEVWFSLCPDERARYAGVSCLKQLQDGRLVGEDYSRMGTNGETYIDRFNKRIRGDKWEIIRTDLHREAKYDLAPKEKYMAPEFAWLKIGQSYKTVFLNEALSIVEYQADGISKNNLIHRASNPISAMRFYELATSVSTSFLNRLRSAINHRRFSLHAGNKSIHPTILSIIAYLPGIIIYRFDLAKLRKMGL